jgi:hypothetical protein
MIIVLYSSRFTIISFKSMSIKKNDFIMNVKAFVIVVIVVAILKKILKIF